MTVPAGHPASHEGPNVSPRRTRKSSHEGHEDHEEKTKKVFVVFVTFVARFSWPVSHYSGINANVQTDPPVGTFAAA